MKLNELLRGFAESDSEMSLSGLELDSRNICAGYAFIALNGALQHGLKYARQAIKNGALAVIYEPVGANLQQLEKLKNVLLIEVVDLNRHYAHIAARYYAHPSQALDVIGITGTNGKTSCCQFLGQVINNAGIIGTLGWGEWGDLQLTENTTPDALQLQHILAKFVKQDKQITFMEVSSHGLEQGRINGIDFKGAVFTNLSRDHLDYHGSMEAYFQTKLVLFQRPKLEFAVVNLDDAYSDRVIQALPKKIQLWTYSRLANQTQKPQQVIASKLRFLETGVVFDVCFQQQQATITTSLYGDFNVENILAVFTTLLALGVTFKEAVQRVSDLEPIAGRMQIFGGGEQPLVVVDYAHTPDALEKSLRAIKQHQQYSLSLVFGCGGDRDKGKRALMGQAACQWADKVIVTNDNPRNETPKSIIADILLGCDKEKVTTVEDRKAAIYQAITNAIKGDCVLIAGKGHENYQETQGVRMPFSDKYEVEQVLMGVQVCL